MQKQLTLFPPLKEVSETKLKNDACRHVMEDAVEALRFRSGMVSDHGIDTEFYNYCYDLGVELKFNKRGSLVNNLYRYFTDRNVKLQDEVYLELAKLAERLFSDVGN